VVLTVAVVLQAIAVWIWISRIDLHIPPPNVFDGSAAVIVAYVAGALVVRWVVAAFRCRSVRGGFSSMWRQPLAWPWAVFLFLILANTYAYAKLMVPALNPRLWDAELAALDQLLLGGLDANIVLLQLVSDAPRWVASALDFYYSLFVPITLAATAWFLTSGPRLRFAFLSGIVVLWSIGFWFYIAVPALGPVFVYADVLPQNFALFPRAAASQRILLENYQKVHLLISGESVDLVRFYGVAAMPSLHVAAPAFFCLWAWRFDRRSRVLFGTMAVLNFIGAVALGWHYAVDGWAGILVAVVAVFVAGRLVPRGSTEGAPADVS
jgi:hypothetical protein